MAQTKFNEAKEALALAHDACFNHPDRDIVGMSHGPFSGVNVALGIISVLERENKRLTKALGDIATCDGKTTADEMRVLAVAASFGVEQVLNASPR